MGKHRRPSAAEIRAQLFIFRRQGSLSFAGHLSCVAANRLGQVPADQATLHQNLSEL